MHKSLLRPTLALGTMLLFSSIVLAETPQDFLKTYATAAQASGNFTGFSASRGEVFFNQTHGNDWSCASCHTANPTQAGKHAKTGKVIDPLAPSANAERFTSTKKVEKWFKRNCNDVLDRECTALEKGDVITYLLTFNR
ncbi:DUF1924 domain-containing protein [Thiofilum flexile]|uniref:DUF1924 domain-containing protein n=1 Tax=Thiofilum flexile TaxID=125627 RepID=UPI0003789120|nr:DUF1924 domain-containing protein [Thiofilum flexile]